MDRFLHKAILYSKECVLPIREDFYNNIAMGRTRNAILDKQRIAFVANTVEEYQFGLETQLLLLGHTQCGMKVSVMLTDLEIYIDVFPSQHIYAEIDDPVYLLLESMENCSTSEVIEALNKRFNFCEFTNAINEFAESHGCKNYKPIHHKIMNLGISTKFVGYRLYFRKTKGFQSSIYDRNSKSGAYTDPRFFVVSYNKGNISDIISARKDLSIGTWMMLQNYDIITKRVTKAKFDLIMHHKDYCQITPEYESLFANLNSYPSLYQFIDIESANVSKSEDLKAQNNQRNILSAENIIFNIGITMSLESDKGARFRINIVNTAAQPSVTRSLVAGFAIPDSFTIVTMSPYDTLLAYIDITRNTMPDFVVGFNSLDFDIPQILLSLRVNNLFDTYFSEVSMLRSDNVFSYKNIYEYRGCQYRYSSGGYTFWSKIATSAQVSGISGQHKVRINSKDTVLKFNDKIQSFKINKEQNPYYHYPRIPGCIMLDVMLISRKKYMKENAKGGMNYYLKKLHLPLKLDMEYWKIWLFYKMSGEYNITALPTIHDGKYYLGKKEISLDVYNALNGESLFTQIRNIVIYCSYDAEASMKLLKCYKFMEEKRKYCVLVNMPLYKNIFQADVAKLENGMRKTILEKEFLFSEDRYVISADTKINPMLNTIIDANPKFRCYFVNEKSPKNKGGYCSISKKGKISAEFIVDGKKYVFAVPVEGVDFASLYPSLIKAYNLCMTTITLSKKVRDHFIELHPEFSFREIPAIELLMDSEFPAQMNDYYSRKYNCDFANSIIYIIDHGNDESRFGILPIYMERFFVERKVRKDRQAAAKESKDKIFNRALRAESQTKLYENSGKEVSMKEFYEDYLYENDEEYRYCCIAEVNEEGGQLAVKVTMNATYGALDYVNGLLYSPLIATLVTFFGRKLIKLSNRVCEENGKTVIYNDTDSTYLHHELEHFQDIVEAFVRGQITRKRMERKMVHRSMRLTSTSAELKRYYRERIAKLETLGGSAAKLEKAKLKLRNVPDKMFIDILNDRFALESGSRVLYQLREETLLPAIYMMPKKYIGLAHERSFKETYTMSDIMMRGVQIRTGNCTKFLSQFTTKLIMRVFNEDSEISDIVFDELNNLLQSEVDYTDLTIYEKMGRYKSNKANAVSKIVDRVKRKALQTDDPKLRTLYRVPFELETVYYIVTKNQEPFDILGRLNKPNKQELSEYSTVITYLIEKQCQNIEIDLEDYIYSCACLCAQLISYNTNFEGYFEGIKHKDYVNILKSHVKKICAEHFKNTETYKLGIQRLASYKEFLKANKDIFERIVYASVEDEAVRTIIMRMINISKKLKFSNKLLNIAQYGFVELGFHKSYLEHYSEEQLREMENNLKTLHNLFAEQFDFLNEARNTIVGQIFNITKTLSFGKINIDEITILRLAYCELLFRTYCGQFAILTGIKKYRCNSAISLVPLD